MNNSEQTTWNNIRETFRKIWGYDNFRPPQREIINCLLKGKDALIIMPTGGGKSICFQLPALLKTGLTLVISPLVALMENQVQELRDRSLPASLLHSQIPNSQKQKTLQTLQQNKLRLLYLSPETLFNQKVWNLLCQPQIKINGLILDEAHCLVQWGETFRPAYRRLGAVRSALIKSKTPNTNIAIAAFTATADPSTQKTLQTVLRLQTPQIIRLNPYRSNLHLAIKTVWTPKGRKKALLRFIQQQGKQSGLVYARTRRGSEALAKWLTAQRLSVCAYHGGLSAVQRRRIEAQWINGHYQFVVCTSAFGMGINKADCRFVVHYEVPSLLAEYAQEVGRGGRDGKAAKALALVSEPTGLLSPEDKQRWTFFEHKAQQLETSARQLVRKIPAEGHIDEVKRTASNAEQALALLHRNGQLRWVDPFHYKLIKKPPQKQTKRISSTKIMQRYLFTRRCRWQVLIEEFGFVQEARDMACGTCDRCLHAKR